MEPKIRSLSVADYPAVADLMTRAQFWEPARSPEFVRHIVEMPDPVGPMQWVAAEVRGWLAGYGMLRHFPGVRPLWVYVVVGPDHQRQRIGSSLLERLLDAARGVEEVAALVPAASPGGPPFAVRHGFHEAFRGRESALDLTAFDPDRFGASGSRLADEGITFAALDEVDSPILRHELHDLVNTTSRDIPTQDPYLPVTFADFERIWFDSPRANPQTMVMALKDGHPVAYSNVVVDDRETGYNGGTGVSRAFRGHGLGTAVKVEALRRAKRWGLREVRTDNDVDNAPMLAINRKLGYRPLPDIIRFVKRLEHVP